MSLLRRNFMQILTKEDRTMNFLLSIHWMPFLALDLVLIAFVLLHLLSERINWTLVILLALVLGAGIGVLFASEDNAWLLWVDLLGRLYE